MNQFLNLNELCIPTDGNYSDDLQKGLSETAHVRELPEELPQKVSVFFEDLEARLVQEIEKHELVFGCVAWLSNRRVLQALAKKKHVGIVIQKEDFLRPDSDDEYGNKIKSLYEALPPMAPFGSGYSVDGWHDKNRIDFFSRVNVCGGEQVGLHPIRIMGLPNPTRKAAMPRMHHKFLCFGSEEEIKSVWTGSFNVTQNATRSRENAVLIEGGEIPLDYYQEFQRVWLASEEIEPHHWRGKWTPGEFRFGT
jgi:phosphatidylserine/phosphatidylglycerophosphate/cardiolipin synthase-like enzyme